jgi:GNAT superfamily N-acetyltransferase
MPATPLSDERRDFDVRSIEPRDHAQLGRFKCSGPIRFSYTKQVQTIIRGSLLDGLRNPEVDVEAIGAFDSDGSLIGVVALQPEEDDPRLWAIHVLGVREEPGWRRIGVGMTLFETALDRCREAGASSATILVHERNVPALGLASKLNVQLHRDRVDRDYMLGSILLTQDQSPTADQVGVASS